MESAMEQCEAKPLPSTLKIFDTFKSQEDDKESDEESFHLPLLGCDDEAENGMEISELNEEDEDAILNKFDIRDEGMDVDECSNKEDSDVSKNNIVELKVELSEEETKLDGIDNLNKDNRIDDLNKDDELVGNNEILEEKTTENIPDDTDTKIENEKNETESGCEEDSKEANIDNSKLECNEITEVNKDIKENSIEYCVETENKETCSEDPSPSNYNGLEDKDNDLENNDNDDHLENNDENHDLETNNLREGSGNKSDNDQNVNIDAAIIIDDEESENTIDQVNECIPKADSILDQELSNDNDQKSDVTEKSENKSENDQDANTDAATIIEDNDSEMSTDQANGCISNENNVLDQELINDITEDDKIENHDKQEENIKEIDDDLCILDDENESSKDNCPIEESQSDLREHEKVTEENATELTSTHSSTKEIVEESNKMDETIDNTHSSTKEIVEESNKMEETIDNTHSSTKKIVEENKMDETNDSTRSSMKEIVEENKMDETDDSTHSSVKEIVEENSKPDETVNDTLVSKDIDDADKKIDHLVDNNTHIKDDQISDSIKDDQVSDSKESKDEHQLSSDNNADSNKEISTETVDSKAEEAESNKDEGESLLDISVIRDVDEDNASAIREIAMIQLQTIENDEQEEAVDNDLEEMEVDQDDNLASSDKDENIEFDEGNTNSCDQDMSNADMISVNTSDSENKENEATENEQSETESHLLSADDLSEMNSNDNSILDTDTKTESTLDETLKGDINEPTEKIPSTAEEPTESAPVGKRPLPDSDNDNETGATKKLKRSEKDPVPEKEKSKDKTKAKPEEKKRKIKTLTAFEKYMKEKNLGEETLTRSDLEQFCLQKICEAIIHKSDAGELHQIILRQAQIIDNLRKEVQQISKQAKDLDIVHKKLMNDIRIHGTSKPLVPLKITRSVGLQVKLNVSEDPNKRKSFTVPAATNKPPTTTPNTAASNANRPRIVQKPNNVQGAQTPTTPVAQRKTPPAAAPILSQALQTRPSPTAATPTSPATAKRVLPLRIKPSEAQKPSAPGVIDLTDEDEKTAKPVATNNVQQKPINTKLGTSVKMISKNVNLIQKKSPAQVTKVKNATKINTNQQKTVAVGNSPVGSKVAPPRGVTPQTVRVSSAQMKNSINLPAGVVTSPATTQIMYVLPQGGVGSNTNTNGPKALLVNFPNGVITSALNGSAVSVIPSKTTSNSQLRPVLPRKHPAPLPHTPPPANSSSVKPLLPKPHLTIKKTDTGLMLQWKMPYNLDSYEAIASYQLYAYQETSAPPSTDMWRKVGDIKALALPMACTLTQFVDKNKYYFAVRPVDVLKRIGLFSDPEEIIL
ncbi:uncharacterized protein [Diabrotica undecimpunctata]|uniref:uncharacterized protein n=1 Tax=Diabrotica undecimpunctata TaxID=50387 RepID=UPI003B636322